MRRNSVYTLLGIIVVLLFAECYSSHAVRCAAAKPVKVGRSRANDINMKYPVLDKMKEKSKPGTGMKENTPKSPSGPSPIGNCH
ncbi:hypothetical protein K1719_001434 [Acacia pycnantha]|nr:hypothetical protein K1719_001434 [Acacia pycnantha]